MFRRVAHLWHVLNLPCSEMSVLASRAVDERLPRLERFAYRLHLLYCSACRRFARQLRNLRSAVRQAAQSEDPAPLVPEQLSDAARARLQAALRNAQTQHRRDS